MSAQSSRGSMSHAKHRATGGPFGKNTGRRDPAGSVMIARQYNEWDKQSKTAKDRLKPQMYGSVQEALRHSR